MIKEELEKEAKEQAKKLEENQTLGVYDRDEDLEYDKGWNAGEVSGYEDGYIAGAKAHLLQWHDLRKDPTDLPKENNEYACRIPYYDSERTFNGFLNYNSERKVFWLDDLESTFTVIAWCEIPKFEEAEND